MILKTTAALFLLCLNFSQALFAAAPPTRAVRIVIVSPGRIDLPGKRFMTGNVVPADFILIILFTQERCAMPIEGAPKMLRAWQRQGAYQLGCWYPTVDNNYMIIDGLGNMRNGGTYWETYPRALLHPDGSATIVEPAYDSETFAGNVIAKKNAEYWSHSNERP